MHFFNSLGSFGSFGLFAVLALGSSRSDDAATHPVDLGANLKRVTHKYGQAGAQKKALDEALVRTKAKLPAFETVVAGGDELYVSIAGITKSLATPRELVKNPFGEVQFSPVATATSKTPAANLDPRKLRYEFGSGGIRLIKDTVAVKGKAGLLDAADDKQLPAAERLAWFIDGVPPESELALAALERAMDVNRHGDALFAYLDFWRNNDESFFDALDRTAGSPEGIFHYDSMLFQYADKFFTSEEKKDPGYLKGGKEFIHEHFHDSFLTIRKYKTLIEAIAYSLILPPDVPLPSRLSRHDFSAVTGTALSVRDEIMILLASNNGDVSKVVEFVQGVFKGYPMPDRLVSHDGYNPVDVLADKVINGILVKKVIDKGWTKEWGGDAAAFNTHHDVAIAYRAFWTARARVIRDAVKGSLETP